MARQRHPLKLEGAQWNKGAERLRHGKKLCRPHREKGRGRQGPNVRAWENRPGADLGWPGSGNGSSEEGQSMRRGRKGAGNDRDASIREGRQRACRRTMGTKKPLQFPARAKYGGPSGTRTPDQPVMSRWL